jgi:hypothetical protein
MNFQLKNTFIKTQCITLSNTNLVKTLVKGLKIQRKVYLLIKININKEMKGRKIFQFKVSNSLKIFGVFWSLGVRLKY